MKARHVIAASLGLALAASRAVAGDAPVDREKVKAQVHHTLSTEGKLPDEAIAALDKGIDRHTGDHGYGEAVSTAVHDALQRGCKGTCLAGVIHDINGAMDKGASAADAARDAGKAHARSGGASDARRDGPRRDAARDRVRDRTMDRGAAGSRAMGAGHR